MNKRQGIFVYALFGAVALGAIGPWFDDPVLYRGADEGGLLVLFCVGLIAACVSFGLVWNSRLGLACMFAILSCCAVVGIHAVYRVLGADEALLAEDLDWGLILTLVALLALLVVFGYRFLLLSSASVRSIVSLASSAFAGSLLAAGAMGIGVVSTTGASGPVGYLDSTVEATLTFDQPRSKKVRVAHTRSSGGTWSVWVFGDSEGGTCWSEEWAGGSGVPGNGLDEREFQYCGALVSGRRWELIAEGSRSRKELEKLLVILTRRNVGYMRVLTGQDSARGGPRWMRANVRSIDPSKARSANLAADVAYAVAAVPSRGCLRRVELYSETGVLLHKSAMRSCKYEEIKPE